ncbi:hypothetical protein [Specibacter cremeus]|uniref:hypothetical protein n=1 Tax=Specibacter cremeus TaxID=1629051 RepID=UPI00197C4C1F|nr:hypothetical protein [Specibacter cremeus]
MAAFAHFSSLLVVGTRNIGEAAVLAYAHVHHSTAVLDDGVARRAAQEAAVSFQGTLGMLCQAIREGLLTVALVSDLADHLMETQYRLPFRPGDFARWANENGLLSPDADGRP